VFVCTSTKTAVIGVLAVWIQQKPKNQKKPFVCVPDVIGALAVWIQQKRKKKVCDLL